ncbi:MAG TPA: ATP-binding protein [bacterium]|nr:ATP-binding protein [bacterium]
MGLFLARQLLFQQGMSTFTAAATEAFLGNPLGKAPAFSNKKINLNKRDILACFRALVLLVLLVLLFFNNADGSSLADPKVFWLLGSFAASIAGMLLMKPLWFEKKAVLPVFFLLDTLFITAGIYLTGVTDTDLFLIFFITVFISAMSQDIKSVFGVAIVSCALYAFLQYKTTGVFFSEDTALLVRFPFLFVAAAMSGFIAMEGKKNKDEKSHLEEMNRFLAQQADASTSKLLETNRRLKSLLEYHHCVLSSLKTGVIVAQMDGTVRTFNAGARQITGFVEAEMADQKLEDLPEALAPVARALEVTLREQKGCLQEHLELKTTRSESIPVTLETSVLKGGNGQMLGAIATLKDMTLLHQMETQLLRAERLSALGEMAAGVAHEIKNPLNAIQGFSNRLSAKITDPSLKKYADIIVEEVRRMDTTINDVLEYSRPDRVAKEPADVHKILEETLAFLSEKLEKARVEVKREFSADFPKVGLDLVKMRQVILNLVLNAVQAMDKGGCLTLKTGVVEGVVPRADGGQNEALIFQQLFLRQKMAVISIEDTGCGIPKENMSKLFHPFFTTKITGTGLGLSICNKIISSHGGTLDVRSTVGKGSVFMIYLPLEDQ